MFRGISHKWNTSWSLAKTSWFYISRDSELFWYGFFSFLFGAIIPIGIAVLVYVFIVLQSGMLTRDTDEHTVEIVFLIAAFVYYLVWAMIRYFFQAAIMTSVERRLEGRDNSFSDGIRGAMS